MADTDVNSGLPSMDGSWGPAVDIHVDQPTPARMYDYFLGGKDNFPVDREAADQVGAMVGKMLARDVVWENRHFLQRAVRWLADAGIDQFIDIGAGLPTQGNVHEIAQQVIPDARVVYVDYDPIVLAHGRALLGDNHTTTVITADMRDPQSVLAHPDLRALIDFSRPVAVLFVAVFHFITDAENPARIVAAFRDVMAPGSYLALSHLTSDGPPADQVAHTEQVYKAATSPMIFRSRTAIESYFDGFDLVDPGLVRPWKWHPAGDGPRTDVFLGGVAIRPA
jgi:SAM-dependent methyltransferase